jgi:hypothetical protein
MAKGVGLRLLSRRGSWVQIPPSAPNFRSVVALCSCVVQVLKYCSLRYKLYLAATLNCLIGG